MNENIKVIEERLSKTLHDCNLGSMVSVDEVKRWMQELDFKDKWVPVSILTGLLDDPIIEQPELIQELVSATITLNQVLPLPSLDGDSFMDVIKKRKEKNVPTTLSTGSTAILSKEWYNPYYKAMQHMHDQQFSKACKKFDETFQKLLELQTTDPDIYRVYCNAGLAYLLSGKPLLGTGCISIAKEINPNYTFASEQLQKIENGDFDELMKIGYTIKIMNNMEKWDDRPDHLNLDQVMDWSEKKILKKLSSYGIAVDKDEFIRTAETVNKAEDVAEKIFYPHVSLTPDNEDFFWIAACALWEKYCPDEQSITGFRNRIHDAYTYISSKDLNKRNVNTLKAKEIQQLRTYLQWIEDYVFSKKKDLVHEWNNMMDIDDSIYGLREFLTSLLFIPTFKDHVLRIVNHLLDQEPDPYWDHIKIINVLQEDETKGKTLFKTIQKQYPYYCYLPSDIGLYYIDRQEFDTAEPYLLEALAVIDKRAKDEKYLIEKTSSTIYEDYMTVLDLLEMLYENNKTSRSQRKWLKNKRKQVEKNKEQLSHSPQHEKMDKALEELVYNDEMEQAENSLPMHYYEFLSQFNINFKTTKKIQVNETYLSINAQSILSSVDKSNKKDKGRSSSKKIGRNDPCPCGSGKKYKKCCGSLVKKK